MASASEKRDTKRRKFRYYMQIVDDTTEQAYGHLSDISQNGFKLDSQVAIVPNKDFHLRVELTSEMSDKPFLTFVARSRWCRPDEFTPNLYNVGFEIIKIGPTDANIFKNIYEKYGSDSIW